MISVCMCTFNGARFVERQVKSILSQLEQGDELLISDDCSTDGTLDILQRISDERIVMVRNDVTLGYTRNFEKCIAMAKGEYIFLSDQDDIWFQTKRECVLNALDRCAVVLHDALVCDELDNPSSVRAGDIRPLSDSFFANFYRVRGLGCCLAMRRGFLDRLLPFPANSRLMTHDAWICLLASSYCSMSVLNEPLIFYRRHGSNTSNGGSPERTGAVFKVSSRVYAAIALMNRHAREWRRLGRLSRSHVASTMRRWLRTGKRGG